MMTTDLKPAHIDTHTSTIHYRGFEINEVYVPKVGNVWEWCHERYVEGSPAEGTCDTLFEAIEAVDDWLEGAIRESRTKIQIEANALDLEMFRLSERMEAFSKLVGDNDVSLDAGHLWGARYTVREHMHPKDREETSGGR